MARNARRRPGGGGAAVFFGKCSVAENNPKPAKVTQPERSLVDVLDGLLAGRWFDPSSPRPLAIGIREEIVAACGLDPGECLRLRTLLGRWTGRRSYLKALSAPSAQCYGIEAQPAEPVSAEHQVAALEQLERVRLKRKRQQVRRRCKAATCEANAAKPVLRLGAAR